MLIKTLLNKVECFNSLISVNSSFMSVNVGDEALIVDIRSRRNSKPVCPECGKCGRTHDTQPGRLFEYVSIWAFKAYFHYASRRVVCPVYGVKVEVMPWGYDDYLVSDIPCQMGAEALLARDCFHIMRKFNEAIDEIWRKNAKEFKVAKMLRKHKVKNLNWFSTKGQVSSGAVEGLYLKAKLTMRKAYDFKSLKCLQVALYYTLGKLSESRCRHRFC